MFKVRFDENAINKLNRRTLYSNIKKYVDGESNLRGRVLAIYGLRQTGKSTLMMQLCSEYGNSRCVIYQAEKGDYMDDVYDKVDEAISEHKDIICIDEISFVEDFVDNSEKLADYYARQGIHIIITGTDSFAISEAKDNALFHRLERVHTTYISFAEHKKLLGTNDIDDYIAFGGIIGVDDSERKRGYIVPEDYLHSSVAGNIAHSIANTSNTIYSKLEILGDDEIEIIINKMVETYSGAFKLKTLNNKLTKGNITRPLNNDAKYILDEESYDYLYENSSQITAEYLKNIGGRDELRHKITNSEVDLLKNILGKLDVLSTANAVRFECHDGEWDNVSPSKKYHIIQPAIKYAHLMIAQEMVKSSPQYNSLSSNDKDWYSTKLDEFIKGDMTEEIITYDVRKSLPRDRYDIVKPEFFIDNNKVGEYDMLIFDKEQQVNYSFEIKHSSSATLFQTKYLMNRQLDSVINTHFGYTQIKAVLYNGNSFINNYGVYYFNSSDFLDKVSEVHDIEAVVNEMSKDLPTIDMSSEDFYYFASDYNRNNYIHQIKVQFTQDGLKAFNLVEGESVGWPEYSSIIDTDYIDLTNSNLLLNIESLTPNITSEKWFYEPIGLKKIMQNFETGRENYKTFPVFGVSNADIRYRATITDDEYVVTTIKDGKEIFWLEAHEITGTNEINLRDQDVVKKLVQTHSPLLENDSFKEVLQDAGVDIQLY